MTLNLFVTLPTIHPGAMGSDYFASAARGLWWALTNGGGIALTLHAYLALVLVLGCLALLVRGVAAHSKLWSWSGGVAALFTIGALFNGLSFVDYSHDFSSMIMASCWLAAVAVVVASLMLDARQPHA